MTVEQYFKEYRQVMLPNDLTEEQIEEYRRAFFAGATMLSIYPEFEQEVFKFSKEMRRKVQNGEIKLYSSLIGEPIQ